MKEMFKGKVNSPATLLVETIDSSITSIKVADGSVFPGGPNVAVIGTDGNAETIKYESVNGNILVGCVRGFQGKASVWDKDTIIARNFTEYDLDALQENILELDKKQLKDFQEDETHRTVTDIEKTAINNSFSKVEQPKIVSGETMILSFTDNSGKKHNIGINRASIVRSGLMSSTDKQKLDGIAEGANKITKLSELENDTTFKTEAEIQQMIEKASSLKKEVVTSLPTTGKDDVIYLVQDPKGKDNNNYLEYLWLNGKYELIGSTQVDLSGYATKNDVEKYQQDVTQITNIVSEIAQKTSHMLTTDYISITFPDTNPNKLATSRQLHSVYQDVEAINQSIAQMGASLEEEVDKKLNISDVQEFTQQELEEAFK